MSELLKESSANILIYLLPEVCGLDGSVMNYTQNVLNQLHVWWPHPCSLLLAFCSMLLCFSVCPVTWIYFILPKINPHQVDKHFERFL